jgi:hypothetical protein
MESMKGVHAVITPEASNAVPEGILADTEAWKRIEDVGVIVADNAWQEPLFNGKSKTELAQRRISPELVARTIGELERGRYIGPLETQPVEWSDTKIYRDIMQNFFDGMKEVAGRPTLDGVTVLERNVGEDQMMRTEFSIHSPVEYDHRYLIHHGGTTKAGDNSVVGGFGEGLKIATFLLLKKGVTDKVELGADHWRAEYYMEELPASEYPEKVRGLYLKAHFVPEPTEGNFLKFQTEGIGAYKVRAQLNDMKNFFWSENNSDFKEPTFENEFGGFKLLPRGQNGNLYVAGQRHEVGKSNAWSGGMPGGHVWSYGKVLERTRDRNYAQQYEVKDKILDPLVKSMPIEQVKELFLAHPEYWTESIKGEASVGRDVVTKAIYRLADELSAAERTELRKSLPDDIFSSGAPAEYESMLRKAGFKKCEYVFAKFGVLDARARVMSLIEDAKEPELKEWEKNRVEVLKKAIAAFVEMAGTEIVMNFMRYFEASSETRNTGKRDHEMDWEEQMRRASKLSSYDVLYKLEAGRVPELTIRETGSILLKGGRGRIELHGFTTLFPKNIFLQRNMLSGNFLGALFTWQHELAHNISGKLDHTHEFQDAERHLHEMLMLASFNSEKLKELQKEWDTIVPEGAARSDGTTAMFDHLRDEEGLFDEGFEDEPPRF